ncbi:MAG: type-F conjugative transfer system secretin TraK [Oligoflexia bacterium]|nr:type-F conjugative transfer system secretin TraK [Oligoflexia bacterium]MBF0367373.1 type-F conjugative transfer system secretin TraK [Oligoflexia bacterium]
MKVLLIIVLMVMCSSVFAVQKLIVNDGDVLKVKLSSRELTRLAVEGGRVDRMWGASGLLESQSDKKDGELFLRPSSTAAKVFSFFVRDNFGSTYTIIAEQQDIPSQTVILAPVKRISKEEKERYKNRNVVSKIKDLIKAMANDELDSKKMESEKHHEEINLWKESRITLVKSYRMEKLKGEVFRFKNISKEAMKLLESEFLNFRKDTLAVAIDQLTLKPEEETNLYVIRRSE